MAPWIVPQQWATKVNGNREDTVFQAVFITRLPEVTSTANQAYAGSFTLLTFLCQR